MFFLEYCMDNSQTLYDLVLKIIDSKSIIECQDIEINVYVDLDHFNLKISDFDKIENVIIEGV